MYAENTSAAVGEMLECASGDYLLCKGIANHQSRYYRETHLFAESHFPRLKRDKCTRLISRKVHACLPKAVGLRNILALRGDAAKHDNGVLRAERALTPSSERTSQSRSSVSFAKSLCEYSETRFSGFSVQMVII